MKLPVMMTLGATALFLSACAAPNEYRTYDTNKASSYSTETHAEESSGFTMTWPDMKFWEVEEDPALVIEEPVMVAEEPVADWNAPAGRVD